MTVMQQLHKLIGWRGRNDELSRVFGALGLDSKQIFNRQAGEHFEVATLGRGLVAQLNYFADAQETQAWGLAQVKLNNGFSAGERPWQGAWFYGISPMAFSLKDAQLLWGHPVALVANRATFEQRTEDGRILAIGLKWVDVAKNARQLASCDVAHMGGYLCQKA